LGKNEVKVTPAESRRLNPIGGGGEARTVKSNFEVVEKKSPVNREIGAVAASRQPA